MAREFTVGGKGSQLRTTGPGPGDSYLAERKVLQIDGAGLSCLLQGGGRAAATLLLLPVIVGAVVSMHRTREDS